MKPVDLERHSCGACCFLKPEPAFASGFNLMEDSEVFIEI
jgi:hypothetical protein